MEAKGHEDLIKRLFPLLNDFQTFHQKKLNFEINPGALYLGNWIADFSQLIDETPIALVSALIKSPEKLLDWLKQIKEFIDVRITATLGKIEKFYHVFVLLPEKVQAELMVSYPILLKTILPLPVPEEIRNAIKKPFEFLSGELGRTITAMEKFVSDYKKSIENLSNRKFDWSVVDETLKALEKKKIKYSAGEIEKYLKRKFFNESCYVYSYNILYTLVKILGYNKFCAVDKRDGLFTEFGLYEYIFRKLYDRYYPHEHLDRPFDLAKVRRIKGDEKLIKQATTIHIYNYLDQRAAKKNIYGKNQRHYLYDYLFEFLELGTGNLLMSEQYFRKFIFSSQPAAKMDFHLELAKVGKTMHVFQDVFAHSNFLDFILVDRKLAKDEMFSDRERNKIHGSIIKLGSDSIFINPVHLQKTDNGFVSLIGKRALVHEIDSRVITGYFTGEDAKVSLYHAFLDAFVYDEDEYDTEKPFFSLENLEICLDAIIDKHLENLEGFTKFIAKTDKISKEIKSQVKDSGINILSAENLKELYTERLKTNRTIYWLSKSDVESLIDKLNLPVSQAGLQMMADFLNNLALARFMFKEGKEYGKDLKQAYAFVKNAFEGVRTVIRIVRILIMYPRAVGSIIRLIAENLFGEVVADLVEEIVKYAMQSLRNQFLQWFENQFLSTERPGSHSLIAKDEHFEKHNRHKIAYEMAHHVDKFVIKNLLQLNIGELFKIKEEKEIQEIKEKFTDWSYVRDLLSGKFLEPTEIKDYYKQEASGYQTNDYQSNPRETSEAVYNKCFKLKPGEIDAATFNAAWEHLNGEIISKKTKNQIFKIPYQQLKTKPSPMITISTDNILWFDKIIEAIKKGTANTEEILNFYINQKDLMAESEIIKKIKDTESKVILQKKNYVESARILSQQ